MEKYMAILKIFIIVLLGSYTKEYIDISSDKTSQKTICISKVLISTLGTSVIIFGLSDFLLIRYGDKIFVIVSYISGLTSYKLIKSLTKVDIKGILPLIKDLKEDEGDD